MTYTILGHHHSGTTCLAKCLINAGVDFGPYLNIALEDVRVMWMDQHLPHGWTPALKHVRDEVLASVEGFKHPYTSRYLEGWEENQQLKKICIVRNPIEWLMADYMFDSEFHCKLKFQNNIYYGSVSNPKMDFWLERWAINYRPILELDIPIVFFDQPDTEEQIISAMAKIGLQYNGGYVHRPDRICQFDVSWTRVAEIWDGLHRNYQRQGAPIKNLSAG